MLKQCPNGANAVNRICWHNVLMSRFRDGAPFRSDVALLVYGLAVAATH